MSKNLIFLLICYSTLAEDPCFKGTTKKCLNGGKCFALDSKTFSCHCPGSFVGDFCEFKNACVPSPCKNMGSCTPYDDSGVCTCKNGFSGRFCDQVKVVEDNLLEDEDEDDIMIENDLLSAFQNKMKHTSLMKKFEGDPCALSRCLNGGTCIPLGKEKYECDCLIQFTGSVCQFQNACQNSKICKNSGSCKTFEDSGVCLCPLGFGGLYCDKIIPIIKIRSKPVKPTTKIPNKPKDVPLPCQDNQISHLCSNRGHCFSTNATHYECKCLEKSKYSGDRCQFRNPCYEFTCKNGICEVFDDSGICNCLAGFTGTFCESEMPIEEGPEITTIKTITDLISSTKKNKFWKRNLGNFGQQIGDHCDNSETDVGKPTCLNGGKCFILDEDSYGCECSPGFIGYLCDEEMEILNIEPDIVVERTNVENNATEIDKQWHLNNVPALEHNYRSKIPSTLPYPYHLDLEPQKFYEDKQKLAVRIPGFEDIDQKLIRVSPDGTIYVRKPKPNKKVENDKIIEQVATPATETSSSTKIVDASVVKVMPNGELFIKMKFPRLSHHHHKHKHKSIKQKQVMF